MTLIIRRAVLPISEGGTGASTGATLAQQLSVAHYSNANVPGGFLKLNSNGEIDEARIAFFIGSNLSGPGSVVANSVNQFTIMDYDCYLAYVVTVTDGSVTIDGNIIQFTAPAAAGDVTLTLNGRNYTISVTA